jgi:hypothetical protein
LAPPQLLQWPPMHIPVLVPGHIMPPPVQIA